MKCSAVITIPARLASQRLPNKMLLNETGCTLIEHTWRNASKVSKAIDVFVVTDSNTIQQEVQSFGGKAIMTSPDATSGTARIVEALPSLPDADIVVNLQGDEPELVPSAIDAAITCLEEYPKADVATLVTPLREKDALHDPSVVKAELTPWTNESLQQEFESCPQVWRAITFSRAQRSRQQENGMMIYLKKHHLYFGSMLAYMHTEDLFSTSGLVCQNHR